VHDQHSHQQKPEASQHKHRVSKVNEEVGVELFDLVGNEVEPSSLEETAQTKQLLLTHWINKEGGGRKGGQGQEEDNVISCWQRLSGN